MFFRRPAPAATEPPTDAALLARYRAQGDVHDVGMLYERHMTAVLAVARRYLRDEADAQDAVMQLFEQLVQKLRRHEVDNFPAWLHATARNHCLMQLRARQRAGPAAGGALVVHFPDAAGMESAAARHQGASAAEEAAEAEEHEQQLQRLESTLAELPPDQRQCLELFYLEKKSYREVADLTGLDLKAVKSHLQNGKRNLRRHLQASHPNASS
ncbi:RNA polymerase sigma factor [Hymenobacter psychrophilus]|uniref:RNA polymerase sigma-70 factor, ECF subfamily n=1 Tax=Hymenobacter psychrophilus TaxID=651662 RepID=A0A1H3JC48_9BACT|nr:sigma-70 family RNA polymerase sigma factor [Hymenobacter psychrophilus]SDY37600.1 RNA polymerase sigma-70 factor, ECF subfamily [Hymenobacter psychrophilus]